MGLISYIVTVCKAKKGRRGQPTILLSLFFSYDESDVDYCLAPQAHLFYLLNERVVSTD